jgi:hypothetical protein
MYDLFGLTRQPLWAFTDVLDRTEHVRGGPTIDTILREVGTNRPHFYRDLDDELSGTLPIDIVSVNEAIYRLVAARVSKTVIGDKTPDYGFYMTLLQRLWRGARFVHLIRDGRDVALSMSQHPGFQRMVSLRVNNWCPIAFNGYYRVGQFHRRLRSARLRIFQGIRHETMSRAVLHDYLRLWESRLTRIADEATRLVAGSYLEVRYEDLLNDPQTVLDRLIAFLQLEAPQGWREEASRIIVRGNTGKITDPRLRGELTSLAGETLKRYGYA